MAGYVASDYVEPGYVEMDEVEVEGVPFLIPFVGANGRLGVTIMGARGALDIPNLSLIIGLSAVQANGKTYWQPGYWQPSWWAQQWWAIA